jgi:hypothetical protein
MTTVRPKDPDRSLQTRYEGLMRKASDLARLNTRVAFIIEGRGRRIQFTTDPSYVPEWTATDTDTTYQPADVDAPAPPAYNSLPPQLPDSPPFTPDLREYDQYLDATEAGSDTSQHSLRPLLEATSSPIQARPVTTSKRRLDSPVQGRSPRNSSS